MILSIGSFGEPSPTIASKITINHLNQYPQGAELKHILFRLTIKYYLGEEKKDNQNRTHSYCIKPSRQYH